MAKPAEKLSGYSKAECQEFFRQMVFLRHFEEKTLQAYRNGKAGGYLHVYSGMEPLAVGWLHHCRIGWDYIITAYRDHAHPLVMGTDPIAVMAEIMGRKTGLSKGKGGSMHLYDAERCFFGGWGIVGAHTALGGGLALAAKYRKEDRVTICYLGDGAANAGVFFETMNMCGLWDLPIIFIIENNLYAMGTALERHAADPELHKRGAPFDFKHERLDASNLLTVLDDSKRIIDWVRKNQKAYLVEAMTYRLSGHGAADNDRQLYRTKAEEDQYALTDPITLFEDYLEKNNIMTREKMEAIEAAEIERCEKIYEEAEKAPHPDPEEVFEDVYTDMKPEVGH